MFYSLVKAKALLFLATTRNQLPLNDTSEDNFESLARNGTLKIWPQRLVDGTPTSTFYCKGTRFNTWPIVPETCVSGNFSSQHSMNLDERPICPDGSNSTLSFWPSQGCVGTPDYNSAKSDHDIPHGCLWGGAHTKSWSMVFHCTATANSPLKHQTVHAPPHRVEEELMRRDWALSDTGGYLTPPKPPEEPTDGVVEGHLFPACNGKRVGGPKRLTVPVDRCLTTPGFGIQIRTAAVCANGTRAQWARFSDSKCGHGTVDPKYGLIDVLDSDIGKCLSTGTIGDEEKIASAAFWCEGVKKTNPEDDKKPKEDEKPEAKKGSVSESACIPWKAPIFKHPKTDTCVDLKTEKMKIISAGVCVNGTQSLLALYNEKGCVGAPAELRDIKDEDINSCLNLSGTSSFAFYCTGEGIEAPSKGTPGNSGNSGGGSIMQFLLVLMLIIMMFFLMLILSILTWVRKYGGSFGKLVDFAKNLVKPKDGGIAL